MADAGRPRACPRPRRRAVNQTLARRARLWRRPGALWWSGALHWWGGKERDNGGVVLFFFPFFFFQFSLPALAERWLG